MPACAVLAGREAGTLLFRVGPFSFLANSASPGSGKRPESVVGHLQAQEGTSASPLKAASRGVCRPLYATTRASYNGNKVASRRDVHLQLAAPSPFHLCTALQRATEPCEGKTSNSCRSCHQSFFRRSDRIISAHKNIQHKGRYTELTQHRFKVSGIGV